MEFQTAHNSVLMMEKNYKGLAAKFALLYLEHQRSMQIRPIIEEEFRLIWERRMQDLRREYDQKYETLLLQLRQKEELILNLQRGISERDVKIHELTTQLQIIESQYQGTIQELSLKLRQTAGRYILLYFEYKRLVQARAIQDETLINGYRNKIKGLASRYVLLQFEYNRTMITKQQLEGDLRVQIEITLKREFESRSQSFLLQIRSLEERVGLLSSENLRLTRFYENNKTLEDKIAILSAENLRSNQERLRLEERLAQISAENMRISLNVQDKNRLEQNINMLAQENQRIIQEKYQLEERISQMSQEIMRLQMGLQIQSQNKVREEDITLLAAENQRLLREKKEFEEKVTILAAQLLRK